MLLSLHVKNMALIQEAEVVFGDGLNILTGETGAGKSIVIGSVNVALGTGNFRDYVPEGAEYALVELVFWTDSPAVRGKLAELEIPDEDGQVVISRKYHNGRSISKINGEIVNISTIRELASELIDIHGQHQHQSLLYKKNHLMLLDKFAKTDLSDLPRICEKEWEAYRSFRQQLKEAVLDESERAKEIDFLKYEIQEIEEAVLRPGEDEELESSFTRMSHGQKIMEALSEIENLTGYESGAGDGVGRAVRCLSGVADYDEKLQGLQQEFSQIEDLLSDANRELADYIADFSYDEQEFYELSRRLDLLNHLKSKYGKSIEDILNYQTKKQERLEQLLDYESYLEDLRVKQKAAMQALKKTAEKISGIRKKHALLLQERIKQSLLELNFLDIQFEIEFQRLEEPGSTGMDEVCFLISMNPGMPLRPLWEVASGGELSRIMLAIKAVMAEKDAIGTLIFDEIDTGISGRTAQKVSEKMALISRSHQIICITHLAQIAAMADTHLIIEKEAASGKTVTSIRRMEEKESIEELARILGGVKITDAVYQNAREMKELAGKIKTAE
ncbi:MAG: DNA repair protein RecN [Lachnospiraceae bacterium]|nr:DNA repair protein RecN [Lachnospiraceae bacterium]